MSDSRSEPIPSLVGFFIALAFAIHGVATATDGNPVDIVTELSTAAGIVYALLFIPRTAQVSADGTVTFIAPLLKRRIPASTIHALEPHRLFPVFVARSTKERIWLFANDEALTGLAFEIRRFNPQLRYPPSEDQPFE